MIGRAGAYHQSIDRRIRELRQQRDPQSGIAVTHWAANGMLTFRYGGMEPGAVSSNRSSRPAPGPDHPDQPFAARSTSRAPGRRASVWSTPREVASDRLSASLCGFADAKAVTGASVRERRHIPGYAGCDFDHTRQSNSNSRRHFQQRYLPATGREIARWKYRQYRLPAPSTSWRRIGRRAGDWLTAIQDS